MCSGNHDLDHRTDGQEKATAWINEAWAGGVVVDGESVTVDGWLVSACAWWEGPVTLQRLEQHLADAEAERGRGWIWAYHGPPEGPLSWTGSRHYGDPELPRLLDRYRPDIVLCGHIHQSPFVADGAWAERRGDTWLFNSGHQPGGIPSHVRLDLDERRASWWSFEGSDDVSLGDARCYPSVIGPISNRESGPSPARSPRERVTRERPSTESTIVRWPSSPRYCSRRSPR